jgi:hypothetical protein
MNMKIFFMRLSVIPMDTNINYEFIGGAYVECWIRSNTPLVAYKKASFDVKKDKWIINKEDSIIPIEMEESVISSKFLESYIEAKKQGTAYTYIAWARDEQSYNPDNIVSKTKNNKNLATFLSEQKKLSNQGRCLHVHAGERCNEIIKAHSTQKSGLLSKIAHKGKVYCLSRNIGDFVKFGGLAVLKKEGINKVSTFRGFCKTHDNELFEPIDNSPLNPAHTNVYHQVFLYAYRSLCKEIFVRENGVNLLINQLETGEKNLAVRELTENLLIGFENGLNNLNRHKEIYDNVLENHNFQDIEYVIFISDDAPFMAFSGLLFPEYDFMGDFLQDLSNTSTPIDLITCCSAPIKNGWAVVFAWHKSSSKTCVSFMRSLATKMFDGYDTGDLIFRFVMNFENAAFSPTWWETLSEQEQRQISERLTVDIHEPTQPDYLTKGLDGISKWKFDKIYNNF